MKVKTIDMSKFDATMEAFQRIAERKKIAGAPRSEVLYYDLLALHFREVKEASNSGKFLVLHTTTVPREIFVAMDIASALNITSCSIIPSALRLHEECYKAAAEVGIAEELCSGHRLSLGVLIRGWFPRANAFVVDNGSGCDNLAKSADLATYLYDMPTFSIDRPYRYDERVVKYTAGQLEDLVRFLEEQSHHKMDWGKLQAAIKYSSRQMELSNEIGKLRKAVPSPMGCRTGSQQQWVHWLYPGRPEGVDYFETLYSELKDRVKSGKGIVPKENFRVVSLFITPQSQFKVLDWMEKVLGVVTVSEPYYHSWRGTYLDPSVPLESLARKYYYEPLCKAWATELEDGILPDAVRDAKEGKADAAIYWLNAPGCRQGGGILRVLRDVLKKEVGIPTLVLECELVDPRLETTVRLKEQIEEFFTMLRAQKEDK